MCSTFMGCIFPERPQRLQPIGLWNLIVCCCLVGLNRIFSSSSQLDLASLWMHCSQLANLLGICVHDWTNEESTTPWPSSYLIDEYMRHPTSLENSSQLIVKDRSDRRMLQCCSANEPPSWWPGHTIASLAAMCRPDPRMQGVAARFVFYWNHFG